MEFNKKLQELRKRKGLTQDELAQALYVSRTAISKWESGRGYPNIDSLKSIALFFGITVDELLSGDELLTVAEEDGKQKERYFCDVVYGLLDLSVAMLLFLPFFRQRTSGYAASLLALCEIAPYLKIAYAVVILSVVIFGVLTLALQNCRRGFWLRNKGIISLALNTLCVFLFVISQQPYASALLLVFLIIKALMLVKHK